MSEDRQNNQTDSEEGETPQTLYALRTLRGGQGSGSENQENQSLGRGRVGKKELVKGEVERPLSIYGQRPCDRASDQKTRKCSRRIRKGKMKNLFVTADPDFGF